MKSNKLSRMGRRRFIKTLSAIGVSGTTLNYLSQDALAELTEDPEEEIPRLLALEHTNQEELQQAAKEGHSVKPTREPQFYTIPRDKWVTVETAHSAAEKIREQISTVGAAQEIPSALENRVAVGVSTVNDQKVVQVYIRYPSWKRANTADSKRELNRLRGLLPDATSGTVGEGHNRETITGIPVLVDQTVVSKHAYYDDEYRPIPGGCQLNKKGTGSVATSATPAYDTDRDETVLVTTGHFGDSGDTIKQPGGSGTTIGSIDKKENTHNLDAATILEVTTFDGEELPGTYEIAADGGGYDYYIDGMLGFDAIKDHEGDTSYDVHSQGRTSGRKSGHILWAGSNSEEFKLDNDTDGGDSGGPAFRVYSSDSCYVAGLLEGGSDTDDDGDQDSHWFYLGHVENEFNVII